MEKVKQFFKVKIAEQKLDFHTVKRIFFKLDLEHRFYRHYRTKWLIIGRKGWGYIKIPIWRTTDHLSCTCGKEFYNRK